MESPVLMLLKVTWNFMLFGLSSVFATATVTGSGNGQPDSMEAIPPGLFPNPPPPGSFGLICSILFNAFRGLFFLQ
ncbi:hypothetical protein [Mucilaginibacter lacusdianchii]|uniref:hypothetical protein n=1 Tax=Mucilaginibacter lacusdianchii TaxID=2684211 RepID=UPI00131C769C|nr:hypothetical protein [Mucilaginibacter sp. JXJ CY 39]